MVLRRLNQALTSETQQDELHVRALYLVKGQGLGGLGSRVEGLGCSPASRLTPVSVSCARRAIGLQVHNFLIRLCGV